jgi:haloalkane dehalogenase
VVSDGALPARWAAEYPFAAHWFDRGGGIRMHYLDEGTGPPVVMLHGNPTWSFYYRNLVQALRQTHRCLVPDHVGMGRSDKPGDDRYAYTLATRVADLGAWIESLRLSKPVVLVVHDWGGMIGMAWATAHPEHMCKLVIFNTAAFGLPAAKAFPWPLALTRTPLGALLVRGLNGFAWTATWAAMARAKMPRHIADAYTWPYGTWADRVATLRFVQDIPLRAGDPGFAIVQKTADSLGRFSQTPTLVMWGGKDWVFDDHFLAEWKRHLPHASIRYLADAGHYVLEDAAEEVVPAVVAFVRGQ